MNYHYITGYSALYTYSYAFTTVQLSLLRCSYQVSVYLVVFTAVITRTCDYCCCFAATAADAVDGALYWCCSIFTAAAAPGAPASALYC